MRFFIYLPETWMLASTGGDVPRAPLAVSPDGHWIAFLASSTDDGSLLWVRSLDTLTAHPLAGKDGARSPFWSPDSRFLGFFADGKLKKIEVSGGPPIVLFDAANTLGGTWSRDGVIVFYTRSGTLEKVSASGGVPTGATALAQGETRHMWPFFLPDGRHFLYRVFTGPGAGPIYVSAFDAAERKLLLNTASANVLYTQGHLLFLREGTLMAQPFDARRLELTGDALPIAEQIQTEAAAFWPHGVFSASENGVLAYQAGAAAAGAQLGVV
jgi:hypothetical protein